VADGDCSTCSFAEFSSKWRTGFSHFRGGSYNQTVVQIQREFRIDAVEAAAELIAVGQEVLAADG
jgi:hypothetical protein